MTQICLSKAYAIIDHKRGEILKQRRETEKGSPMRSTFNSVLHHLNQLKKELALVSDSDQIPLGL